TESSPSGEEDNAASTDTEETADDDTPADETDAEASESAEEDSETDEDAAEETDPAEEVAASTSAPAAATKTPRPLSREARLESKRGMLAAKILLFQLEKTPPEPPQPAVLLRLVATFGARTPVDMRSWTNANASSSAKTLLAPWIAFDKSGSHPDEEVRAALWKEVLKILRARLTAYGRMPVLTHGTTAWKEVRAIVNTLGLDRTTLEADVARQIPTPKSWSKAA
ncbi:MAG: hypothetical protein K8H90_03275, partial [Thermoanaerobaculia bacterium]|nr:hypothetical protein [Thermoanaerobaculia bacterium]